tara:strand:- start:196 stop:741 length:546 start_codon:yes stop_codon:yes gene_type:complete
MKKYIIIIISFFLVSNLSAQSFGLKGGTSLTNFIGSDSEGSKLSPGFIIGAFMKFGESNIEFMPEILFHQKGEKSDNGAASIVLNYVDLAANGLFHINDELALSVGPYAGYLLSGTLDSKSVTVWDLYNRTEFGANIGAIYNVNDLLHIDFRYGFGFTDIMKATSLRNSSVQIGFGYVFGY